MRCQIIPFPRFVGLALCLVLIVQSVQAADTDADADRILEYQNESDQGEFNFDDSLVAPWIENETEIPPVPEIGGMYQADMDQLPEGVELLVDLQGITINPQDRVIRVWLWVRSKYGAENGTYEGYRCATREFKVYAFANPKRKPPITVPKRTRWKIAKRSRNGNYRAELLDDYFCGFREARSVDQIAEAMTGEFRRDIIQNR